MADISQAAQTIAKFLDSFTAHSGLRLRYRVKLRTKKSPEPTDASPPNQDSEGRSLYVEFMGPDSSILTGHNGEVLNALEHIAAKILRLEPEQHDLVLFDADHFKAGRDRQMRESAAMAVERVRLSGRPYSFAPMSSRERRMLHLILSESGLPTASSGEGAGRYVVLYPAGADTSQPPDPVQSRVQTVPRPDANRVRASFRHR
jgi:spoIIIJ-associated protein